MFPHLWQWRALLKSQNEEKEFPTCVCLIALSTPPPDFLSSSHVLTKTQQSPSHTSPRVACTWAAVPLRSCFNLELYLGILPTVMHLISPPEQTIPSDQAVRRALTRSPNALLGCQTRSPAGDTNWLTRGVFREMSLLPACAPPPTASTTTTTAPSHSPWSTLSVIHWGALPPPPASHLTSAFEMQVFQRKQPILYYFVVTFFFLWVCDTQGSSCINRVYCAEKLSNRGEFWFNRQELLHSIT